MEQKAPEKIYLNPLLMEDGESIVRQCTFERQRDSQIEYIRTDAFIEKACEWLRCNNNLHDGEIDDYVNDFKNYIEGE